MSHTVVLAQPMDVVVTYGPAVAAVPTLSQWLMIVMSALLAIAALVAIRKKASRNSVLSIVLATLFSIGAVTESNWLPLASANGYTSYSLSAGTGGRLSVPATRGFAYVLNDTSIPQRIISIEPQYPDPQPIDDKPACVPGLRLEPTKACALLTRAPV